jgi:RNA polymerase-binding transcription factor DksA
VTRDAVSPCDSSHIERVPEKWREYYERLSSLLDRLTRECGRFARDLSVDKPRLSQQMAEAATDSYDQDWALSVLSSEQDAVYEIQHAIERIRHGTYGVCELTGKRIPRDRLRAIPWTRFSH